MERFHNHEDRSAGTWIDGEGTAVFVPTGYEPTYAYPVIVWLEDSSGEGGGARRCFPLASDRNCIVISLLPPLRSALTSRCGEWRNGGDDVWPAIEYVGTSVAEVAAEMNIHRKRVYLAGEGTGAAMACDLLSILPDQYAGALAIQPTGPVASASLHDWRGASKRSVLLVVPEAEHSSVATLRRTRMEIEVLSGMGQDQIPAMLIRWVMSKIPTSSAMD
jgi:predicted peptidase